MNSHGAPWACEESDLRRRPRSLRPIGRITRSPTARQPVSTKEHPHPGHPANRRTRTSSPARPWTPRTEARPISSIPLTGRSMRAPARSGPEDVERALHAAEDAFESWSSRTPSQRSLAVFRFADALEARAEELVDIECRNTGKPKHLTMSEEIPPMIDQIRFFAGACRLLEGRSAGEYMEGFTSFVRREPVGVCAQITPWNYPMMMAVVEVRARHRGRQHRRAQAGTHHARQHRVHGRGRGRVLSPRRVQRGVRQQP